MKHSVVIKVHASVGVLSSTPRDNHKQYIESVKIVCLFVVCYSCGMSCSLLITTRKLSHLSFVLMSLDERLHLLEEKKSD